MEDSLHESWKQALKEEFSLPYFASLRTKVEMAYRGPAPVYPPPELVFNAFALCPFNAVKVVILGQDPYHGVGQAQGLCFSVPAGVRIPPSLQNIYKELNTDLGVTTRTSGDLRYWAQQGVLLLNATLTVEAGHPASHQGLGWERFTDAVIKKISDTKEHVVFLLWGKYAQSKSSLIESSKHLILTAPHPSPFSAHSGFFGCKHFSQTNEYLTAHERKPINW